MIQQSQANEEFLEENDTERLLTVIEKIVAIHTLLIEGSASPDALFAFSNTVSRLYSAYTVLASTTPGYVKGLARLLEYPAKISQFASFGSDRKLLVASIKLQGIVSVIGPQVQPRIIL